MNAALLIFGIVIIVRGMYIVIQVNSNSDHAPQNKAQTEQQTPQNTVQILQTPQKTQQQKKIQTGRCGLERSQVDGTLNTTQVSVRSMSMSRTKLVIEMNSVSANTSVNSDGKPKNDDIDKDNDCDHDGLNFRFKTRLSEFFDESFDKENNYVNVRREFKMFVNHCSRELCVENILFWIHWVQLLNILIKYNIIDKNNDNHINSTFKNCSCQHYICDTFLIQQLKQDLESINIDEANETNNGNDDHDDDGDDNSDGSRKNDNASDTVAINKQCQALAKFYKGLFKEFVEGGKAPFELNISGENRQILTEWYHKLINNYNDQYLTQDLFVNQLWSVIKFTAIDIRMLVDASLRRFQIKQQQ